MKSKRVFTICIAAIAVWMMFLASARAEPGAPFWSMYVGNYWVYSGVTDPPQSTWTWRTEVVATDDTTIPGVTTYLFENRDNGVLNEREWYSITPSELRFWRMEFDDDDNGSLETVVTIDGGMIVAKNPVIVGDSWTQATTGTFGGFPVDVTMVFNVVSYEWITVPQGTYRAYKIHRVMTVPQLGGIVEVCDTWIVPYLGIVRWKYDEPSVSYIESLSSMNITNVKKGAADFDGDGKTDIAIYREAWGAWYLQPSGDGGVVGLGWGGNATDIPVPGDYDGDGRTDVAIYRAENGAWWIIPSSTGTPYGVGHGGGATDIPVPGDYDGDGKTDVAIYRQAWGAWYIIPSAGADVIALGFGGGATDIPVPADYDGDGKTDVAIYRAENGAWWIIPSSTGIPYGVGLGGGATDTPVPGDYDGDGKTDVAIYRQEWGTWFIRPSSGGADIGLGWGGGLTDIPVPGDYDGDGKTDVAIYRAESGAWWIIPSTTETPYGVGFGGDPTDLPVILNPAFRD